MSSSSHSALTVQERERLEMERDYLLMSLCDLDAEREAGDVDEADYETLRQGYVRRTADVLRALDEAVLDDPQSPAVSPRTFRQVLGRRRVRFAMLAMLLVSLAGAVLAMVMSAATTRLPGQFATGSVTLSKAGEVRQQLDAAAILGSKGDVRDAVHLYGQVLAEQPRNAQALTYQGWLARLTGIAGHSPPTVEKADAEIKKAIDIDPSYGDARAFYAIVLLQDRHDIKGAITQFDAFLVHHPSKALLNGLAPSIVKTYEQSHIPIPALLRRFIGPSTKS